MLKEFFFAGETPTLSDVIWIASVVVVGLLGILVGLMN